jgi:nitrogen fixation protein NifU and related proteins
MPDDFQTRVAEAIRNPANLGEMENADAVGVVGSPGCGEMLKMWIKFKEQNGRKVIDRASFQSFGCETAIAVASLATELIKGKTAEEALSLSGEALSGELGPLPPMKIHCSQLVEEALRKALQPPVPAPAPALAEERPASSLMESFVQATANQGARLVLLPPAKTGGEGTREQGKEGNKG